MPLYTYECTVCKHVFDELGLFEEREKECPKCQKLAVRIPARANFFFNCTMPTYQRPKNDS